MKRPLTIEVGFYAFFCFFACAGDFIVTFLLAASYPGYSSIDQSESFLGTSDSPVAVYMNTWGVIFSVSVMFFVWGLRKTIFRRGTWQTILVWCILFYGLGEGMGSGLFPYDFSNNELTFSGELHAIFGALSGVVVAFIPFAATKIFPRDLFPTMHKYSWYSFSIGLLFIFLFTISREEIIPFKGLWQRLFILDYHLFLMVLAVIMYKKRTSIVGEYKNS